MNLAEVCRLCLVKSIKTSEELFFPIDEVFESKFTEITSVTLNSSERFPSTICISCVTEFEDFYNYRSGLIQKQKRLNLLLGIKEEKTVKSEIIKKQKVVHTAVQESIQAQNEEMLEDTNQNNPEDNKRQYDEQPDYEYEHIEYQDEHEHNRMIFEEVLENEQYEEEYEIEPSDQSKSLIKLAESEEYFLQNEDEEFVESTDECVEEVEHIEDEEIIFAISAEDMKEECIVVKSEASFLESVINERQKRKYVKQEKEKLFRCWIDDCNAAFSFRSTMKKHMNQAHLVICDKKTCLMCGQRFDEYSDFLNHVKKHTRKAECDICKLTFVSEEKMQAHRARVHKNDENERCFQCPLCDASFKRKEHVNSHIVYRHTENRKYPCELCSSTFLTKQDLKNHEKSHQQLKKNCAYCPYECRDLKSIKLHCLKFHNTSRIYKCSCEEAFELFKDYQSHKKNCYSVVDSTTAE